jgi:hypothetical protein
MAAGTENQALMVRHLTIHWQMSEIQVPSQSFGAEVEETLLSMFQKGASCYDV